LNELNNLDFYQQTHPKSLGFEFVKETVILIIESLEIDITDKMRTTEHIALQIAIALPLKKEHYLSLRRSLQRFSYRANTNFTSIKIIIPENTILEFKEAVIFALLGVLKLRGQINVLSSVTELKQITVAGISTNQNNISNTQFALYYYFYICQN
jgi:anhydro-N-acetylmuramic acid kinase